MENITTYQGIFKNEYKEVPIEISNDGYELSFMIEKLKFRATSLKEWGLCNEDEIDDNTFDILSLASQIKQQGVSLVTEYLLKDCTIMISVPQQVLDNNTLKEITVPLQVLVEISGNATNISLSVTLDQTEVKVHEKASFDTALKELIELFGRKYTIFNCYTCCYSGYNIYTRPDFGGLQCYKKFGEKILKVDDSTSYLSVHNLGYETVQETYLCDKFQLPIKGQFLFK